MHFEFYQRGVTDEMRVSWNNFLTWRGESRKGDSVQQKALRNVSWRYALNSNAENSMSWCLKCRARLNARAEFSGRSCASFEWPRLVVAVGVSHDDQRAQTCFLDGLGLQKHHRHSTKRRPANEKQMWNLGGREEIKRPNSWAVQLRAVQHM